MPRPRKDVVRILPPTGSKSFPAYVVKRYGKPDRYRYVIQKPGAEPENVEADTLPEIKVMRARSERTLVEHEMLTFDKAIALYMATYVAPSGTKEGTNRTKEGRLRGIFEPVLNLACARLTPERGHTLYMGKVAPKLGPDGKPVIIEQGYIHRDTKKPRRVAAPGVDPDRSGRGQGLISGRYQGIGPRFQRCQTCGEVGHNRRAHRGKPATTPLPPKDEARFGPPSVAQHQAALKEGKRFMDWLGREGFITLDRNGHHALSHVKPFGHKPDSGFGKAKLTDEELIALDRACVFILTNLATLPEEVRLAWQQRAAGVLLVLRCGARTGEVLTARRRQFTILRKPCAAMYPPCEADHGGHVAGQLQVIRESAKTKTSVRDLPIAPGLMAYLLPLLEGKHMEHFFLAGAPRGRTGFGMGGANWERDPAVGFSKRWLANSLAKLCEIAGVRKVNPHSLRGNYVDSRIKRGDPFADVSRGAGHGKTKTTERHYASEQVLAESDQRRMRERLGYDSDSDGRN